MDISGKLVALQINSVCGWPGGERFLAKGVGMGVPIPTPYVLAVFSIFG